MIAPGSNEKKTAPGAEKKLYFAPGLDEILNAHIHVKMWTRAKISFGRPVTRMDGLQNAKAAR